MNGAGKKVWGYYPTTDTWIPLQVDANGKVVVDMSGISLGDLGDTWLPAPGDQYFLYWDDAASKWDCRILVDADIPDGIARDAEVDTKIAAHHDTIIKDADEDTKVDVEESADEDKIRMDVKGVEAFLLDDAGILTLAKQSAAKMDSTLQQPIPTGAWTIVNFNTVIYDCQGDEADITNNRITVKRAGTYILATRNSIYNMPDACILATGIYVNGSEVVANNYGCNYAGVNANVQAVTLHLLGANNYVQSKVYQNSGTARNLSQYTGQNWLAVVKIA